MGATPARFAASLIVGIYHPHATRGVLIPLVGGMAIAIWRATRHLLVSVKSSE